MLRPIGWYWLSILWQKTVEINLNDEMRKTALFVRIIRAHDCAIYNYIAFGDFY